MPRIQPIDQDRATPEAAAVLTTVKAKMGGVPNILATMVNSPAAANFYLAASGALGAGKLSAELRESIALVVAERNSCDYCLAAHTAIGKGAGLTDEGIRNARLGAGADSAATAALTFARLLVDRDGVVSDEEFAAVRSAGFDDGEIAEIVANVALNIFTNYFNHVAGTAVDFPPAAELAA